MRILCLFRPHDWVPTEVDMLIPREGEEPVPRRVIKRTCSRCGVVEYDIP